MDSRDIIRFRKNLLAWYRRHKRDLPFRRTRDPYAIWLSETMLQQTTVATVLPYYERFIAKFPTPRAVAKADDAELLALWQGLGYYSRIRNFKTACGQITTEFNGKIPASFDALKKLKGIGDYTAAAVASIAFDLPHAVVDGNVKRVISRLDAYKTDIASKEATAFFANRTRELLDAGSPGDFNQAIMELGAMVCRPRAPSCESCPVGAFCRAARQSDPSRFPVKKKSVFTEVAFHALLISNANRILLRKPHADSLIRGMWELPGSYGKESQNLKLAISRHRALGSVRHAITNKRITTHVYEPKGGVKRNDCRFVSRDKLAVLPINTLTKKILKKFWME